MKIFNVFTVCSILSGLFVSEAWSQYPNHQLPQHPRSEIHPWTAHPVHFYFSLVAGIRSAAPGFETVSINPQPGELTFIKADYPTVKGDIKLDLQFKDSKLSGSVELPEGMSGTLHWQGKTISLKQDANII